MTEHVFTKTIMEILSKDFGRDANNIYEKSYILQYLNIKTRSADKGSKSRGSFANLYAIYVLVEDYLEQGFDKSKNYSKYSGAAFSKLLIRQRELPFGRKLQNHALNHRFNEEFKKYFPTCKYTPILRDIETNRYWINENLIKFDNNEQEINLASVIMNIIDVYVKTKKEALETFISTCRQIQNISGEKDEMVERFIFDLLAPTVDARLFEIVSYVILKYHYHDQKIYFGFDPEDLKEEHLALYKTGRTNANDGGIDYVMKPLGRFFQVTETLDVKKYFLDIDKVKKYPITFVIKSNDSVDVLMSKLHEGAEKLYIIKTIVENYMNCIEEIINISILKERFRGAIKNGYLMLILDEIIEQSMVEFNYGEE